MSRLGTGAASSQSVRFATARQAEDHVTQILVARGWQIIARNFRWIGTEIDIVAGKGKTIVAVEVKFRSRAPEVMTDFTSLLPPRKLQALQKGLRCALRYHQHSLGGKAANFRIDLAIVTPAHPANHKTKALPDSKSGSALRVMWFAGVTAN